MGKARVNDILIDRARGSVMISEAEMRPQALFKLLVCLSLILLLVVGLLRLLDREGILVLENFLLALGR